jgi:hypothetical protein
MGVTAGTIQTYGFATLREDLSSAENMISPTETPFLTAIKKVKAKNKLHEWPLTELGAVDASNIVIEGEAAPAVNSGITPFRRQNFTQISDKVLLLSDSTPKHDEAAGTESMAKQVSYKLKELKRDKETMLLQGNAAAPGSASVARQSAGFGAFLITNPTRAAAGTPIAPTLSNSPRTGDGYPNAAASGGTAEALTEANFNLAMMNAWNSGGNPTYAYVTAAHKRKISTTFVANATRYKSADDKKLVAAIDVYESDFGQVQIVPDRFMTTGSIYLVDPEYVALATLMETRQVPLARTGHAESILIQCEYTLEVGNEKAHSGVMNLTSTGS